MVANADGVAGKGAWQNGANAGLLWGITLVCSLLLAASGVALAQGLSCSDQQGKPGDSVSFTIQVDSAPTVVEAFGFDVVYDSNVLRYAQTFQAGELTRRFNFFNAHEASPGRIRVAGFTIADPIQVGRTGPLVTLTFTVANHGNATLSLVKPVDGMAGWPTRAGRFTGEALPEPAPSLPQASTPPASVSQQTGGVFAGPPGQVTQTPALPATSPVQSSAVQPPTSQPQAPASPSPSTPPASTIPAPSPPAPTTPAPSPTTQTRSTSTQQTRPQTSSPPGTVPATPIVIPSPVDTRKSTAEGTVSTPLAPASTERGAAVVGSATPVDGPSRAVETDISGARQALGEESKVSARGTQAIGSRQANTTGLLQATEPASQVSQKTAALLPPGGHLPSATTPASAPAPRAQSSPLQGESAPAPPSGGMSLNLSVAAVAVAAVMLGVVVVVLMSSRTTASSARRGERKPGT